MSTQPQQSQQHGIVPAQQTEIKKVFRGIEDVLRDTSSISKFKEALGDLERFVSADKLIRVVLNAVNNDWKLLESNPRTILAATMQLAQVGLVPDSFLGQAYLISYNNTIERDGKKVKERQAQAQVGYRGFGELIARSGKANGHDAQVVFSNDLFEFEQGSEPYIRHRRLLSGRGEAIGAYSVIYQKEGPNRFEIMDMAELARIQACSRGSDDKDSPWKTWWTEMARKSPLRRLAKYVSLSPEFARAATIDEGNELGYSRFDEKRGEYVMDQPKAETERPPMPKEAQRIIVGERAAVQPQNGGPSPAPEAATADTSASTATQAPTEAPVVAASDQEEKVSKSDSKTTAVPSDQPLRETHYEPLPQVEQPDPYDGRENKGGKHISVAQMKRLFAILNSAKAHSEEELKAYLHERNYRDARFIPHDPKAIYEECCTWAGGDKLKVNGGK